MNKELAPLNDEFGSAPTSTKQCEVGGKKYVVVSHYVGNKDFKKVFCDLAYRQVLADMLNPLTKL